MKQLAIHSRSIVCCWPRRSRWRWNRRCNSRRRCSCRRNRSRRCSQCSCRRSFSRRCSSRSRYCSRCYWCCSQCAWRCSSRCWSLAHSPVDMMCSTARNCVMVLQQAVNLALPHCYQTTLHLDVSFYFFYWLVPSSVRYSTYLHFPNSLTVTLFS